MEYASMINKQFKSVIELVKAFPTQEICIAHLEQLRWAGNVVSPYSDTAKVWKCAGNKYKCSSTGKYFNVCTNTLFDSTKIELPTWFLAIYLITAHKKGISSLQLSRDLNVTQKTAWFMNHRIRNCFGINEPIEDGEKMGGEGVVVEADATITGGKVKNMSNKKRREIKEGVRGINDNKTAVLAIIERSNKIRMQIIPANMGEKELVKDAVESDSVLMTDSATTYAAIGKGYAFHGIADHSKSEYVKDEVCHTNTLEGAFSLFDRMIIGIYHSVSAKHLQKYINEFCYRYNSRISSDCNRFNTLLSNTEKRLTYKMLIAK